MQIEIDDKPIEFKLCGLSSSVHDDQFAEVGLGLMKKMWAIVNQTETQTTGVVHWVYPHNVATMFVGVELVGEQQVPAELEPMQFALERSLKHVHIGPYNLLPKKWKALKREVSDRGERFDSHSLEIYGHDCPDEAEQRTTVLMGLEAK